VLPQRGHARVSGSGVFGDGYQSQPDREAGLMRTKADVGQPRRIGGFGGSGRLSLRRAPLERHGLQHFGKCAFAIAQACHGQSGAIGAGARA